MAARAWEYQAPKRVTKGNNFSVRTALNCTFKMNCRIAGRAFIYAIADAKCLFKWMATLPPSPGFGGQERDYPCWRRVLPKCLRQQDALTRRAVEFAAAQFEVASPSLAALAPPQNRVKASSNSSCRRQLPGPPEFQLSPMHDVNELNMTTVFCYFRVADYDFWRAGYARAIEATKEVRSFQIWRGEDDRSYVITAETFDSREIAEAIWTSQETKDAMKGDGIDMSSVRVEYLDEVAPSTKRSS